VTREADVHVDDERCIELLSGLLPPPERERLLAHTARCVECEERLRLRGAERVRIEARAPEGYRSATQRPRFRPWPVPRWAAPAGLAAAACLVVVLVLSRSRSPIPQPAWLPAGDGVVDLRGGGEDEALAAGIEAYARRDLDAAIDRLRAAKEAGSYEVARGIYLGSALVARGAFDEAADLLGRLPLQIAVEPWRSEARWNYYVALSGARRRAAADSMLRALAREPGVVGDRARAAQRRWW
jgi:hypothetical protein